MATKTTKNEIVFRVDAFTPDTFPMARLAEYLTSLAVLLGETPHVHLARIGKGSAKVIQKVDPPAIEKVTARLTLVKSGSAPDVAMRAYEKVDDLLRADRATGQIKIGRAKLLDFPGASAETETAEDIGPVIQEDFVDGQLIRVGGQDETVPVTLREADGTIHRCTTDMERSMKIAPFLFGVELRVSGKGHWHRDQYGNWKMKMFRIEHFEELDSSTLKDAASSLRAVQSDEWPDNMLEELRDMRNEA